MWNQEFLVKVLMHHKFVLCRLEAAESALFTVSAYPHFRIACPDMTTKLVQMHLYT